MRSIQQIAIDVLRCATSWEQGARIVGDVTALELARLAAAQLITCPACGAEAWCDIDCGLCCAMSATERPDPPSVCPGCHAVGEERCAPGCIDAEIEAEHRHAIESGDYGRDEDEDVDTESIVPRGAIPPYIGGGMWLEDAENGTGEWFVRDIFDVDDGCMALLERAGCEPFQMHTSELRKYWRLARDYDPNAEMM